MKQDIRSKAWLKALSLLLAIGFSVAAFLGWVYCGVHWDTLFELGDWTYSNAYSQVMNQYYDRLMQLTDYEHSLYDGNSLTYLENQRYEELKAALDPAATNFRYIVRNNATGEILFSSCGESSLENVTDVWRASRNWSQDYFYVTYDDTTEKYLYYDSNGKTLYISEYPDEDLIDVELAIEYGTNAALRVKDEFTKAQSTFIRGNIDYFYLTVILTAAALIWIVFSLCCAARRKGHDAFVLNWQDKIPYDLYLCLSGWAIFMSFAAATQPLEEITVYYRQGTYANVLYTVAGALLALAFSLVMALLMTTAARLKTHTLLKNTLIWRFLKWLGRGCGRLGNWWRATFGNWTITQRTILLFFAYLLGAILTGFTVVLIPLYQGAVLFVLCRWVEEWRHIREGTQAIVGGRPETVIDASHMKRFPDLAQHAEQLNDLGSAINSAVDERMRSERMKAELITNVSHDLKTPLTSIINYVDLLKKEDIQEEKAREYIQVLDRKSQRLKKLTEDLVEASKASTGALTVNAERLGVVQLLTQALGEYSEKFAAANLIMVPTLTEEEVYVQADGRHFWRILDNLMGNCVKYAMPGTRVYLDLVRWDGSIVLSMKNISANQLNIPADQLLERFVRGDESRTTEGSGLGLSIARSLTELQGGTFRLEVDGDLFKATITFPES